ncbi:unnamed protein product [Trichogramma brassicae]|uniref:Uncharacterized protein n=1 Tax=Trichogramma brassicae TaxID=86971 RepID=A0A6H5I3W8_9HYME|nr:unnamed protein product [Trichogramma brassicae]
MFYLKTVILARFPRTFKRTLTHWGTGETTTASLAVRKTRPQRFTTVRNENNPKNFPHSLRRKYRNVHPDGFERHVWDTIWSKSCPITHPSSRSTKLLDANLRDLFASINRTSNLHKKFTKIMIFWIRCPKKSYPYNLNIENKRMTVRLDRANEPDVPPKLPEVTGELYLSPTLYLQQPEHATVAIYLWKYRSLLRTKAQVHHLRGATSEAYPDTPILSHRGSHWSYSVLSAVSVGSVPLSSTFTLTRPRPHAIVKSRSRSFFTEDSERLSTKMIIGSCPSLARTSLCTRH